MAFSLYLFLFVFGYCIIVHSSPVFFYILFQSPRIFSIVLAIKIDMRTIQTFIGVSVQYS